MKTFVTVLIVIVVLVIGYFWLTGTTTTNTDDQQQDDNTTNVVGDRSDWDQFSGTIFTNWSFTIEHPEVVTVDTPQSNSYSFKYVGPQSEPNTEITDGFLLTLATDRVDSLDTYIQRERPSGEVSETTFMGYQARTYTTESQLNGEDIPHTVFRLGADGDMVIVVDVVTNVSGTTAAQDRYNRTINTMLQTLSFTETQTDRDEETVSNENVTVESPTVGASISSPVEVTGEARGPWYFEATFPVMVVDWDGRIIGEGFAEAEGDWMTEDFVPFTATVEYNIATNAVSDRGTVILQRANPSGLPENDAAVEIPVTLGEVE